MISFLKKKHKEKTEEEREKAAESKAKQLRLAIKFLGEAQVRATIVQESKRGYSKLYKDMKKEGITDITSKAMVDRTNRGIIQVGVDLGLPREMFIAMAQEVIDKNG